MPTDAGNSPSDASVAEVLADAEPPYDSPHHAIEKQPFLELVKLHPGPELYTLHVADFTGDGLADVFATTGPNGPGLVLFSQNAQHELSDAVVLAADKSHVGRVADFDADGHPDALTISEEALTLYAGIGSDVERPPITLATAPLTRNAISIDSGDFDGDGNLDVAFRSSDIQTDPTRLVILHGDGTGAFSAPVVLDFPPNALAGIVTGNLDDDPADEIACVLYGTQESEVDIVDESAPGVLTVVAKLPSMVTGGLTRGLFVGDLGSDGVEDILLAEWSMSASSQVTIWSAKALDSPRAWESWERPSQVLIADMDGDSRDDLLVQHDGWFALGIGMTPGGLLQGEVLAPFADVRPLDHSLVAGDINGDGKTDLIGASPYGLLIARHEP